MTQVLTWGSNGLTLGQLRASVNPMSLLPNIPLGADQLVQDLMGYLAATSSIANIQAAVVGADNELKQNRSNLQPAPAAVAPGWMQIIDDSGNVQIVPQWTIAEPTGTIQNGLTQNGKSFSSTLSAYKQSTDQVKITAQGGAEGFGTVFDLIGIFGSGGASYSLWNVDASCTEVDIGSSSTA
jgi:hypothetical protein